MNRKLAIVMFLLAAAPAGVSAQPVPELVTRGIAAYRALEYDTAARLLRRALASGADSLVGRARAEPLTYLGAAEQLQGNAETAASSFTQALAHNPRYRVDTLIFPPEIARAFEAARMRTAFVEVVAPPDTTIGGTQPYVARIYTSAPHRVEVALVRPTGERVVSFYSGSVQDSMRVTWNGTDNPAGGGTLVDGRFVLRVQSTSSTGAQRTMQADLSAQKLPFDTLPPPARPVIQRTPVAKRTWSPWYGALAAGIGTGLAAVIIPEVVGGDGTPMPERYVVGGALTTAGVIGFLSRKKESTTVVEAPRNAAADAEWNRKAAEVRSENDKRRRAQMIRVTTGRFTAASGGDK